MSVAEIQQKYVRERKSGREKILNFGNHINEIPADRNQLWQCHCRNRGKKKFVAMPLPKMGGKKINK